MGLHWFSFANTLFTGGVLGEGTPHSFLIITLLHASTTTDGQTCAERLRLSEAAAGVQEAALGEVGCAGEGCPCSPSSEWALEGLGSRQLGGALSGMVDLRPPTYLLPCSHCFAHIVCNPRNNREGRGGYFCFAEESQWGTVNWPT